MSQLPITPSITLIRNQTIFSSQVDQDLVMLDEKAGLYFGLNSVAHKIWELLEKPITYTDLLNTLMDSYDVQLSQCQQEVEQFLDKLLHHKLAHIVENI